MAKGNEVRFGLGSPEGQYSMLWRAWVQGDELYLAARRMVSFIKLSLHSSGIWRWAWPKDSALDREIAGDRVHRRWTRPPPYIPGWALGPSVMFPCAPVEGWGADPVETTKNVSWLHPPPEGQKVTVTLLLAEPSVISARDLREEKTTPLLAELHLRSGGRVWVVSKRERMSAEELWGVDDVESRRLESHVIGLAGTAIITAESQATPLFVEMRVPKAQE